MTIKQKKSGWSRKSLRSKTEPWNEERERDGWSHKSLRYEAGAS